MLGFVDSRERREHAGPLAGRNRRTALALIGWIVLLAVTSVIVVWVRN